MKNENSEKTMTDLVANEDHSISTFLVSTISGYYTDELIDAIWNQTYNLDVLEAIETYLWNLHDAKQYGEFIGALRILYLAFDVAMPDVVGDILQSGNTELLNVYFHEFLSDFEELKYEYDTSDESEDE